jgi:hypothetical protein
MLCAMLLMAASSVAATSSASAQIPDERIAEARTLLDTSKIGTRYIAGTHAVLAVWKPGSQEPVRTVNVWNGVSKDPAFTVDLIRRAGVGTLYAVTAPEGYVQIGIRTNVTDPTKKPWFKGVTTISVTDAIVTDERVAEGMRYLAEDVIRPARIRLAARGVRSAVRGWTVEPVASRVSDVTLMAIMLVERAVPEISAGMDPETAFRRTLTALALNRDEAFDYARSPVGARGIAQFMPSTYRAMRAGYPRARIDWNFVRGAQDHVNAAMAQVCLADHILAKDLTPAQLRRFVAAGDLETGAIIAAAYNGGPKYSSRALRRHPATWDAEHSWRIDRKMPGLLPPTVRYVAAFREAYRYLLAHSRTQ